MCRLKLSRLFCLLFALSVFFGSFGLSASAASDNLISSDLTTWTNYEEIDSSYEGLCEVFEPRNNIQVVRLLTEYPENSSQGIFSGIIFDNFDFKSGHNYTLSFYLPTYEEISPYWSFISDNLFNLSYTQGVLQVCFGFLQSDGSFTTEENQLIYVNEENYKSALGRSHTINFNCSEYTGTPCIYIFVLGANTQSTYHYYFLKDITLVDNDKSDEEGFFTRLFEWFEKKFNAIGESFSNLGNKLTELKDGFVNKITELKDSFVEKIESLKQSVIDLGNNILEGIKNLFVPDEAFIVTWKGELELLLQERLGVIWSAGDFFISVIQLIGDLLTTTADDIHYELPEMVIELNGNTYTLWQAQQVDFSFLEKNAFFAMLYKLYKAVLNVFLGIPLLNYAKKEMDATLHN